VINILFNIYYIILDTHNKGGYNHYSYRTGAKQEVFEYEDDVSTEKEEKKESSWL
jgi:hypothetical protein